MLDAISAYIGKSAFCNMFLLEVLVSCLLEGT
uniref:Uncharacterized protein n=1 Tax=Arundo donax TaxID=35708 RepID=A0A0A8YN27_ARUDO